MFKVGDEVKIISKSTGKTLHQIHKYNVNEPQIITNIYNEKARKLYIIKDDYYLEEDLEYIRGFEVKLDDKLFEI